MHRSFTSGKTTVPALLSLLAMTAMTGACAQDNFGGGDQFGSGFGFGTQQYGSSGPYEVRSQESLIGGENVPTFTRHHRWGQATGIGSSNSQTTAATAESMPAFNYQPTSVSPALQAGMQLPSSQPSFSSRMTSPALSPTSITAPGLSLSGQISPHTYEGARPSLMTGQSYMLYGLTPSAQSQTGSPSRWLDLNRDLEQP